MKIFAVFLMLISLHTPIVWGQEFSGTIHFYANPETSHAIIGGVIASRSDNMESNSSWHWRLLRSRGGGSVEDGDEVFLFAAEPCNANDCYHVAGIRAEIAGAVDSYHLPTALVFETSPGVRASDRWVINPYGALIGLGSEENQGDYRLRINLNEGDIAIPPGAWLKITKPDRVNSIHAVGFTADNKGSLFPGLDPGQLQMFGRDVTLGAENSGGDGKRCLAVTN